MISHCENSVGVLVCVSILLPDRNLVEGNQHVSSVCHKMFEGTQSDHGSMGISLRVASGRIRRTWSFTRILQAFQVETRLTVYRLLDIWKLLGDRVGGSSLRLPIPGPAKNDNWRTKWFNSARTFLSIFSCICMLILISISQNKCSKKLVLFRGSRFPVEVNKWLCFCLFSHFFFEMSLERSDELRNDLKNSYWSRE